MRMRLKDPALLVTTMTQQGATLRGAKAACGLASHSMIQQLRTGEKRTCSPGLATRLSEYLLVKTEFLFDVAVSSPAERTIQRKGAQ
jgi:hypothetical protein